MITTKEALKAARQSLGLSQAKLAKVLGVGTRQIERIEAGTSEVSGPIGLAVELLLLSQDHPEVQRMLKQ